MRQRQADIAGRISYGMELKTESYRNEVENWILQDVHSRTTNAIGSQYIRLLSEGFYCGQQTAPYNRSQSQHLQDTELR